MAGTPEKPNCKLPEDKDGRWGPGFPNHREHSWCNTEHVNECPAGNGGPTGLSSILSSMEKPPSLGDQESRCKA
ncbi:hypothetical protein GH733_004381 [Mirounga leonina]|nr:hypothetical protein GH733_004381 [Mirounga leonina]